MRDLDVLVERLVDLNKLLEKLDDQCARQHYRPNVQGETPTEANRRCLLSAIAEIEREIGALASAEP